MIAEFRLQFGPTETEGPLSVPVQPLTVIVGPNNAGKSLLLRELEQLAVAGHFGTSRILQSITLRQFSEEEAAEFVNKVTDEESTRVQGPGIVSLRTNQSNRRHTGSRQGFIDQITSGTHQPFVIEMFLGAYTLRLDGKTRLALVDPQKGGDLTGKPTNHLMALFLDRVRRASVQSLVAAALKLNIVVDPSEMLQLRVRLADRPATDLDEEESLGARGRVYRAAASDIDQFSDGVKAFCGLTIAAAGIDQRVLLIDEPEAFLHPPLARRLAANLATLAQESKTVVVAATHSADFLSGAVLSGVPTNVLRLTFTDGRPTARLLRSSEITLMMRDPLLRSSDVLNAVFFDAAVVCEADSDRVFYQEINERISFATAEHQGAKNCLFLNANGKPTVPRIVAALRKLGIPAAAIVDLDAIEEEHELRPLLRSAGCAMDVEDELVSLCSTVYGHFQEASLTPSDGIARLGDAHRRVALEMIQRLASYGLFLVPVGEPEHWLQILGVAVPKRRWLATILTVLGTERDKPEYVRAGNDDVWEFIRRVGSWLAGPREGMSVR